MKRLFVRYIYLASLATVICMVTEARPFSEDSWKFWLLYITGMIGYCIGSFDLRWPKSYER